MAPQLRRPAAGARARRPAERGRRSALQRARSRTRCRSPSASRTPSRASCRSGTGRSRRRCATGGGCSIAAHGNSLRALVKHLDGVSDADIVGLNIPTGMPLVYELDDGLRPMRHYYLGDQAAIAAKVHAVAAQGKAAQLEPAAPRASPLAGCSPRRGSVAAAGAARGGAARAARPHRSPAAGARGVRGRARRGAPTSCASPRPRSRRPTGGSRSSRSSASACAREAAKIAADSARAPRRPRSRARRRSARLLYARYTQGEREPAADAALGRRSARDRTPARVRELPRARPRRPDRPGARRPRAARGARGGARASRPRRSRQSKPAPGRAGHAAGEGRGAPAGARAGSATAPGKARTDLATAQRNEARLARLVEELARAVRPPPRAGPPGPIRAPAHRRSARSAGSRGASARRCKGNFGPVWRSDAGGGPSPKGVFFRAPEGDEVRAVAGGRVVFADWMRGYGNLLIVDHGDDLPEHLRQQRGRIEAGR